MTLNGAIMQLVEMRENSMMPVVFKPYFDKVIETISECVEPSEIPRWIPVTERLPEKKDEYIVTVNQDGYPYTSEDHWTGEKWWAYLNKHITAWMPLPQPYTEETNAQNN